MNRIQSIRREYQSNYPPLLCFNRLNVKELFKLFTKFGMKYESVFISQSIDILLEQVRKTSKTSFYNSRDNQIIPKYKLSDILIFSFPHISTFFFLLRPLNTLHLISSKTASTSASKCKRNQTLISKRSSLQSSNSSNLEKLISQINSRHRFKKLKSKSSKSPRHKLRNPKSKSSFQPSSWKQNIKRLLLK